MELTTYPRVGQKCRFDPYRETSGLVSGIADGKFGLVTGEIIYVNLRHKWFLARYGEKHKRIGFKFADVGKLVMVKGMKMPEPVVEKPKMKTVAKPVICISTGKAYPSVKAAAIDVGLSESSVATCCRRIMKEVRGLQFRFADEVNK